MAGLIDWNKIKEGDKATFERMFDLYYQPLCGFISSYIKNNHVVEDIVIECFVEMWEKRQSIVIKSSLYNYLLTVVKNAAISYQRKNKVQFAELEGLSLGNEESNNPLEEMSVLNRLYVAINKLPEKRRQILRMTVYEGKSYPQVAEELGISVNTVKTQISRSYRFLKEELNVPDQFIFFLLSREVQCFE
ncbi:RNA polymerase sigma-70 factor [Maribellus luteus]|uniref:RNA polymerase sigma-70 factor n=1 Tax=Maribellus luteus TaxID=2305463 RepID=A0A399T0H4_9BACT|nr:RNA polymerase sigma-70 factor [Maribellus luteus]RIJ48135.1 RNA polymerase sigma-70 factor [Maribellus luteus]